MITAQIFGLVLTACSINAQGEVTDCEEHIIDVSYRKSVCYTQLEKEIPNLLLVGCTDEAKASQRSCNELESLKCEVLEDY